MRTRFQSVLLGVLCTVLGACAESTPDGGPPAEATESSDPSAVIEAHVGFVHALETSDVEGLARILDPSSELLLFHPTVSSRIDGIDEATRAFERTFRSLGPTEWTDVHSSVNVHGDVAWFTSHVLLESAALEEPFVGRATEIWIRRPDGWKLVHGHWSAEPSGS